MTDEQTAQSILMDSRIGNDRVALKQAIVAALDAARREGVTSVHEDNNKARVYEFANMVNEARSGGSIIDCTGEVPIVRRVLGTLPVTADGVVVGRGVFESWYIDEGIVSHGRMSCHAKAAFPDRYSEIAELQPFGGVVKCYSTESAAKAAMEGGKA
jgi:hypothetical protein